jgi:threonine dehydrogenase-like Zn-dependent dehydrogenase
MSGNSPGAVRAGVLVAREKIEIQTFDPPALTPDAAILQVEMCGVCGADFEAYAHPVSDPVVPMVLGHEVLGRIRAIGDVAARKWGCGPGDRVVVNEVIPCGQCDICSTGHAELCNGFFGTAGSRYGNIAVTEGSGLWGGYAELMVLRPGTQLVPIRDDVPAEIAAMFMPVANGVHWLGELGQIRPGQSVLVIGPGAQGLAVTAVAAQMPGVRVLVSGRSADAARLDLARELGAVPVDGETENVVELARSFTGGSGVDLVVITTSNAVSTLQIATRCARIGGRIVIAGTNGWRSEAAFKSDALVFRSLQIIGAPGHSRKSVQGAVRFLEKSADALKPLVGRTFGLDDLDKVLARSLGSERGIHLTVSPLP